MVTDRHVVVRPVRHGVTRDRGRRWGGWTRDATSRTCEDAVEDHRLTTVMGVARAVLATVGVPAAVHALLDEYGWDRTFQALALLRGEDAETAFGLVWQSLLLDVVVDEQDERVRDR
jgi:hypothetical protein